MTAAAAKLQADGVPAELATEAAALLESYGLLDVVDLIELADREKEPRDPFEVAAAVLLDVRASRDQPGAGPR